MDAVRREADCSGLQRQLSQLHDKLSIAVSENERLQRAIGELEKWKEKLEKESELTRVFIFCQLYIPIQLKG